MRRREFIAGLGSAAAWPVVAWGQRQAPECAPSAVKPSRPPSPGSAGSVGQSVDSASLKAPFRGRRRSNPCRRAPSRT
jgi:hypothetical protein